MAVSEMQNPKPRHGIEIAHSHPDISGGWLRAAAFGAIDGLVTNTSLVAGVGASGAAMSTILMSGLAGLFAGAFSMALGEFSSVGTQNQQIAAEVKKEQIEIINNEQAEILELAAHLEELGVRPATALQASQEIHEDQNTAVAVHIMHELGVDPYSKPKPIIAAVSSFIMFACGAIFPLIPLLCGAHFFWPGLVTGAIGMLLLGAISAKLVHDSPWQGALKQLLWGVLASGVTFIIGHALGTVVTS